jgi:hypothetical protein
MCHLWEFKESIMLIILSGLSSFNFGVAFCSCVQIVLLFLFSTCCCCYKWEFSPALLGPNVFLPTFYTCDVYKAKNVCHVEESMSSNSMPNQQLVLYESIGFSCVLYRVSITISCPFWKREFSELNFHILCGFCWLPMSWVLTNLLVINLATAQGHKSTSLKCLKLCTYSTTP